MKKLDLSRYHGRFVKLVKKYMKENDLNQQNVADKVLIQRSHLSAILNQAPNRPLTGYYLQRFIVAGIFKVDDIYDGKAKGHKELDFWRIARVAENHSLLVKIARLKERGIDVEAILNAVDPDTKSRQ